MIKIANMDKKGAMAARVIELLRTNGTSESRYMKVVDNGKTLYTLAGAMSEIYSMKHNWGVWVRIRDSDRPSYGFRMDGVIREYTPHYKTRMFYFGSRESEGIIDKIVEGAPLHELIDMFVEFCQLKGDRS